MTLKWEPLLAWANGEVDMVWMICRHPSISSLMQTPFEVLYIDGIKFLNTNQVYVFILYRCL